MASKNKWYSNLIRGSGELLEAFASPPSIAGNANDGAAAPPPRLQRAARPAIPADLGDMAGLIMVDLETSRVEEATAAFNSLHALIADSQPHQKKASSLGAATMVIKAMSKFPDDRAVQRKGCQCLQALCYDGPSKSQVAELGGLAAVASVFIEFPDACEVLTAAPQALQNLLANRNAEQARFVNDLEGIERIVGTMKRFPDSLALQGTCCRVFEILAAQSEFHAAIKDAGAVSLIVKAALENHREDKHIQSSAWNILQQVFTRNVGPDNNNDAGSGE